MSSPHGPTAAMLTPGLMPSLLRSDGGCSIFCFHRSATGLSCNCSSAVSVRTVRRPWLAETPTISLNSTLTSYSP